MSFHADEVFAVAALLFIYPNATIIRTRSPRIIDDADFVVDVGHKHDPSKGRFDHHQDGFDKKRENGIPYASFGLIWLWFGHQITKNPDITARISKNLVQAIDALDNRIDIYEGKNNVNPMILQSVIALFRPTWEEPNSIYHVNKAFLEAVNLAKRIIERSIAQEKAQLEADKIIIEAVGRSTDKRIVVLPGKYVPWQWATIYSSKQALCVIFQDSFNSDYKVHCVPIKAGYPYYRKKFPEKWGGLSGQDFVDITGVEDALFCHPNLYLCGASSKAGALTLAQFLVDT